MRKSTDLILAAAAAELIISAFGATPAAASVASLSGMWTNVDPNSRDIAEIAVAPAGGTKVTIRVFGACEPTACDWGPAPGATYSPGVSGNAVADAIAATTIYQQGFAHRLVVLQQAGPNELRYQIFSAFDDGSGRNSYLASGLLHRAPRLLHLH